MAAGTPPRTAEPCRGPPLTGALLQLDRYVARDSPVHRADARVKFLVAVCSIVAISLLPVAAFAALLFGWLVVIGVSTFARLGPLRPARAALVAAPFLLAALPLVVTRSGEPLGSIVLGPLTLTLSGQGIREFATIALKSWISVQIAVILTFTTPFPDLVDGLRALRLPPVFVAIVGFMYRYLQVLADEGARMLRARAARSAAAPTGRSGGSLGWRMRVVGGMVGSLFVRAYERSERVHAAMLARGFTGELRYLPVPPLAARQLLGLAVAVAALSAFVVAAHLWLEP